MRFSPGVNDYNIPSNNRELQQMQNIKKRLVIITYQVITGNYNFRSLVFPCSDIITYQVITGNYNKVDVHNEKAEL